MARTHDSEFPDVPIPGFVLAMVSEGFLEDTSWHNDVAPSFETKGMRVWIDSPDPRQREAWPFPTTRFWVTADDESLSMRTDDERELALWLEVRRRSWRAKRTATSG